MDHEELSPGQLTRDERTVWLSDFLSRYPNDLESERPHITHINCVMYYPCLNINLSSWNDRWYLINLMVQLSTVTFNYCFCSYQCMYHFFPDYSDDEFCKVVYKIIVFNESNDLKKFFHDTICKMCSRYCCKIFEQAKYHTDLLNNVGIFPVPSEKEYYEPSFLMEILHY